MQKKTRKQRRDKRAHTKEASASCPGEEARVGRAADTGRTGTPRSRERQAEGAADKGDGVEGGEGEEGEGEEGGGSVWDPVVRRSRAEEHAGSRGAHVPMLSLPLALAPHAGTGRGAAPPRGQPAEAGVRVLGQPLVVAVGSCRGAPPWELGLA